MQTITTQNWTQITGLDGTKKYILQAQYIPEIGPQPVRLENRPIQVMWYQGSDAPESTTEGVITDQIKADASVSIYVKSLAYPVNIIVQEVI